MGFKWKRDALTGVPSERVKDRLDEKYLEADGSFKPSEFPDCNVFDVRSIAALAGFHQPYNFQRRGLTDPSSPFHLRPVLDLEGKILTYCTHANSAIAGGESYRESAKTRMNAGKKAVTNVSGGSGIKRK